LTCDDRDHDAVLARIAELEATNARLASENELLRAGAPPIVERVPTRVGLEPSHRPLLTAPEVLGRALLYIVVFLLGEA
jgi:hypothetical protein